MRGTGYSACNRDTLLGLYHGYDRARLVLAKLVAHYDPGPLRADTIQHELWARCRRAGFAAELFHKHCDPRAKDDDIRRGAHSAALTAFTTISDKAEEVLEILTSRWPALREDAGGPLPTRLSGYAGRAIALAQEDCEAIPTPSQHTPPSVRAGRIRAHPGELPSPCD